MLELRAELLHAAASLKVVRVSAFAGERSLGSCLGEAASAELAEDRAIARLLERLGQGPAGAAAQAPAAVEGAACGAAGFAAAGGLAERGVGADGGGLAGGGCLAGGGGVADRPVVTGPASPQPPQTSQAELLQAPPAQDLPPQQPPPEQPPPEQPPPEQSLPEQSPPEQSLPQAPTAQDPPPQDPSVQQSLPQQQPPPEQPPPEQSLPQQPPLQASPQEPPPQEPAPLDPEDWSGELTAVDLALQRLGWGREQEAVFLERAFGHPSRSRLTTYADLLAYLRCLEGLEAGSDPATAAVPLRRRDLLQISDQLLSSLGWEAEQGRAFLERQLGVSSRQQLSDAQLLHFNMALEAELIAAATPS